MAGIASDRAGVNASPIAGIGEGNLTPAVGDFMSAFRSGFLTVEDLTKRGAALPASVAGSQQDLQDQLQIRPLQRQGAVQQISSDMQLQPRRTALQSGQIDAAITALPTATETQASGATREKTAQQLNALNSTVPGVREKAIASLSNEQVIDTWTAAHGQPPPETIEVPGGGVEPKPIDQWVTEVYGQGVLATDAQAVLNRPDVVQGYAAYVEEARNRPLTYFKGDSEYLQALKNDLRQADLKQGIQAAQLKALPTVLEAQAKAQSEGPSRVGKLEGDLVAQSTSRLKAFRDQAEAFEKVSGLENKPSPTNADDVSLIYSYIKLLDPNSAVREGEIQLTQRASPLTDRLIQQYRRLYAREEGVLSPQTRLNYIDTVKTLFEGVKSANRPEVERIAAAAASGGGDIQNILTSTERSLLAPQTGTAGPVLPSVGGIKPGDVVTLRDGRRIRVKSVTATGIVPDLDNPIQ